MGDGWVDGGINRGIYRKLEMLKLTREKEEGRSWDAGTKGLVRMLFLRRCCSNLYSFFDVREQFSCMSSSERVRDNDD